MDRRRVSLYQYLVIGLCALAMVADGFNTQLISYAAPLIAKEWSLTPAALGPIFSSALVGLMIGYLVLPPLSDHYGHRRLVIFGHLVLRHVHPTDRVRPGSGRLDHPAISCRDRTRRRRPERR